MTITLNHTIVVARDAEATAQFVTDLLGIAPAKRLGHFVVVQVGDTSLDYVSGDGEIEQRHFAFLTSEEEFDAIFARIKGQGLQYWADPFRRQPDAINTYDDGRGVYFEDPDGHLLEVLTRSYGSGGTGAKNPNPLLSR